MAGSAFGAGQTSGRFYLEKDYYALSEPIFVDFQVVNNGPKPATFHFGDPYSIEPMCSPYRITVSTDLDVQRPKLSCPPRALSIGCGDLNVVLQPGESRVDRILLNVRYDIHTAGRYTVQAAYGFPFAGRPADAPEAHAAFDFLVVEKPVDEKMLQPWVDQLQSTDPWKRLQAARTLASVAPRSLEDTLLAFANDQWIRAYAPMALHRLNTPRSLAALKDLVANTAPGTWEHRKAVEYLANDQCAGDF